MINGDISNETPPRLIIVADVVAELVETEKKRVLLPSTTERHIANVNSPVLSQLWRITSHYALSVELAGFASEGWDEKWLETLFARLDKRGTNPFNYFEVYEDPQMLISDMPYRPNLQGVVDIPARALMYGSKSIDLFNL